MKTKAMCLSFLLIVLSLFKNLVVAQVVYNDTIYTSTNLAGHIIFAECNPGGGTNCPCSEYDAAINSFADYGYVTSNVRHLNTFVNAIGYKKFSETFPSGDSISLSIYKYAGYIRLPVIPVANYSQSQNPQGVHFMIQVWDGRGELFGITDSSFEGSIYWELNPWVQPSGKVYIYKTDTSNPSGYKLIETGISITPDTLWHRFELEIDLVQRKYVSVTVDGTNKEMNYPMHRVYHPDWGQDISLIITTETSATWPGYNCNYIFFWTTYFKDIVFTKGSSSTEINDNIVTLKENSLEQNYPNPFNPSTTIQFSILEQSFVKLEIFNSLGEKVSTLVSEELNAGSYKYDWSAVNIPSGVYYYKLLANNFSQTRKLVLLK